MPNSINARIVCGGSLGVGPWLIALGLMVYGLAIKNSIAGDWSGNVALESRQFLESAPKSSHNSNFSAFGELEYYHSFAGDTNNIVIKPFWRLDENDRQRTHGDVRELAWLHYNDHFELRAGISKVFWGVAESRHLVDIINQTDNLENIDGEDKLGQPMVHFSYLSDDTGVFDFFLLPYFRQREFAGKNGRPALGLPIVDKPVYASGDEENHLDFAVRWNHSLGVWDIGIGYFDGTSRAPRMVAGISDNAPVLIPHYDQISQLGIDAQATTEEWLWKMEAVYVDTHGQSNDTALVAGFEYTFVGVFATAADIGVISEYLFDEREATEPLQNDLLLGVRWVLNDEQSSEWLLGAIQDLEGGARSFNLEASRRVGGNFKLSTQLRLISHAGDDVVLRPVANDDFLQFELGYYF